MLQNSFWEEFIKHKGALQNTICGAPIFAYRESKNVDVILEKQLYSAEKVQNKPWRYSQRQMWNIFYFPALCRDFLRHTGLETAVFPLYPQLFQIKSYGQQK